jgi:hypothetical protein
MIIVKRLPPWDHSLASVVRYLKKVIQFISNILIYCIRNSCQHKRQRAKVLSEVVSRVETVSLEYHIAALTDHNKHTSP